jgi:hypothetical protein
MTDRVSIPVTLQIEAMLNGQVDLLLKSSYGCAPVDPTPYLTVSRADLEHYFAQRPELTRDYYDRQHAIETTHDINRIDAVGRTYRVSTLDHGRTRFPRLFETLAGAVSEHLLRVYGIS